MSTILAITLVVVVSGVVCFMLLNKSHEKKPSGSIIKFTKTYQSTGKWGYHKEVTDAKILAELYVLGEKYNFNILSTSIKRWPEQCEIKILCDEKDKTAIFTELCLRLSDQIENVSY